MFIVSKNVFQVYSSSCAQAMNNFSKSEIDIRYKLCKKLSIANLNLRNISECTEPLKVSVKSFGKPNTKMHTKNKVYKQIFRYDRTFKGFG